MKTQEKLKESLLQEKNELQERFNKLINFINSEDYYKLSENYKSTLSNQKIIMEMYLEILNKRLYDNIDEINVSNFSYVSLILPLMLGNMFSVNSQLDKETKKQEKFIKDKLEKEKIEDK